MALWKSALALQGSIYIRLAEFPLNIKEAGEMVGGLLFYKIGANLLTLYMIALLLRWVAPYLELDLAYGRWKPMARITDPLIDGMRRVLPPMGMVDFAAPAAVLLVWIVRLIVFKY